MSIENDNKITLNINESNQLLFKMKIKGTEKSPDDVRLVFSSDKFAYSIYGNLVEDQEDVYKFDVPKLSNQLKEGTYSSKIEVIVDGRYFDPIKFETHFECPMEIQAESLVVNKNTKPLVEKVNLKEDKETSVQVQMMPVTKQKFSSLREKYQNRKA